ncbi:hypothetical protein I4U23_003896 [Adineta vaga]|nr:hypothetical protein I4U23_003896 [Adineta vaga]
MAHTSNHSNHESNVYSRNRQFQQVGVNVRRMVVKILTQYSSDFVVCRELIQNADDAQATTFQFQIICDTSNSSSLLEEKDFHNRTITELRMKNNGKIFSKTDWKRVATIAEGNTDPQSVGQFGVGFFSVFAYAEEPIITSGEEYIKFIWNGDSLLYEQDILPVQQQSDKTAIILSMRDKYILQTGSHLNSSQETKTVIPTINLTELKAYFAKVLLFTRHIETLTVKINSLNVFQISKKKSANSSISNTFTFKPQSSMNQILYLNSFDVTEQIYTIDNTSSITLGHVTVEADVNVDQQFYDYIERTLKGLPSTIQIQLLFVPIHTIINQQQLQTSLARESLNSEILKSILPLKFLNGDEIIPSGFIFIGLGTHQSTGIGMHVYSHFIPTVEREELNLQDPYIARWNRELLASVGQIARCLYDQTISQSSHNRSHIHYNAVIRPYCFQSTTPNEKVGDIVRIGFFAVGNKLLVPIKQSPSTKQLSLVPSTQAYLADSKHIHEFLSLSLVPFEIGKHHFFTALQDYQLINLVDKPFVEKQLMSSILLFNELIELLHWLCTCSMTDRSYVKRILPIIRFRETTNSSSTSFQKLKYYDATNLSSVLPVPENVLPSNIAGYFSQEQLQHNLFLIPCTFKDLLDSYLKESQYHLFCNAKTAECLLSNLSKHSHLFSLSKWSEIKNILANLKCIPTTQGMMLPNESYIPSKMSTPDSAIIKLNVVSDDALANQINVKNSDENLVSTYFLKQIGCRMLNIQSIIKQWHQHSGNLSQLNQENMQTLIENLMKERKYITDADWKVLKESQFLQGTTLKSTNRTKQQNYIPRELHFPSAAKELSWDELLILDWHDIDSNSAEFAFLKELGVKEVPDLYSLIDRIILEHNDKQRQFRETNRKYKLPIALRFFAKSFQKHYSTIWKPNDIQQAFLPSYLSTQTNNNNIILSKLDKVFRKSNPLYATLLLEVERLFEKHHIISLVGIKEQPTLVQAFDTVMERKNELLTNNSAGQIFAYLNGLEGLNQTFIKRLSNTTFIPSNGSSTLRKPSQVFIRQVTNSNPMDLDISGLLDYVDFGPEGNSLLLTIGVLHFPPIPILAELLLDRQETYFANLTNDKIILDQKISVYTDCLKRIALVASKTPEFQDGSLERRLKTEPWCLGFQIIERSDNRTRCFKIVKPTEIYLNNDLQCERTHRPICPNEPSLNTLYEQFGAKWLSECVTRDVAPKGRKKSTNQSNELKEKIQHRLNILFVDNQGKPLASLKETHFQSLKSNLSVYEVKNIQCRLTFQNKTKLVDSKDSSSCTLQYENSEVILYLREDSSNSSYDYADISKELADFVFEKSSELLISLTKDRLTSSVDSLERHGFPARYLLQISPVPIQPPPPDQQPLPKSQGITLLLGGFLSLFGRLPRPGKKAKLDDHSILPGQSDEPASGIVNRTISPQNTSLSNSRDHIETVVPDISQIPNPTTEREQINASTNVERHQHKSKPTPAMHLTENFKSGNIHMNRKLRHIVQNSRPYSNSFFAHSGYVDIEQYESCEFVPDTNMKIYPNSGISIPLFIEENVKVTDEMLDQAKQLAYVLINLAEHVFKLSTEALHLYRDINGSRIAFNTKGSLFFNLRYFEQIYADELQAYLKKRTGSNGIINTIVNFYFMVICHELVHNINSSHNIDFINSLEELAVQYMVQKDIFLANFSFNQLT